MARLLLDRGADLEAKAHVGLAHASLNLREAYGWSLGLELPMA